MISPVFMRITRFLCYFSFKKVNNFDLSFTSTICVKLSNGITTYVSRRYVPKLKRSWEYEVNVMKKKIIKRSLLGFPLGITIGYLITILISLGLANGYYSPCVPELISLMGNEINAVVLQTILCGILGVGFAASSVIWEIDNWSIVKQTGIYFSIISVIMLPIAYFAY